MKEHTGIYQINDGREGGPPTSLSIKKSPLYERYINYLIREDELHPDAAENEAELQFTVVEDIFKSAKRALHVQTNKDAVTTRLENIFISDYLYEKQIASALQIASRKRQFPKDALSIAKADYHPPMSDEQNDIDVMSARDWSIIKHFIERTVKGNGSLSQILSDIAAIEEETDYSNLLPILEKGGVNPDPKMTPWIITPEMGYVDIHVKRVSANPMIQGVCMAHTLPLLQKELAHIVKDTDVQIIRGVSWLIKPKFESLFAKMGWTREKGVTFHYLDMRSLATNWGYWNEGLHTVSKAEALRASLGCVSHSPDSIENYLQSGTLPNVGVVRIPRTALGK